jgi:hypothetical protein
LAIESTGNGFLSAKVYMYAGRVAVIRALQLCVCGACLPEMVTLIVRKR